jgi:hypothetical protein
LFEKDEKKRKKRRKNYKRFKRIRKSFLESSNFIKIIENKFFVDKTKYIEIIEKKEKEAILAFYPKKKFGKSLFCNILQKYYDIKEKDNFDKNLYRKSYFILKLDFSGH